MAMSCRHKEYDAEECEILVCADPPAPHNLSRYNRLRFDLLASSWLPTPVGNFLWSVLHVMLLIVGGPVLWLLGMLIAFLIFSVYVFASSLILLAAILGVIGLFAVAADLLCLLVWFCWSLVDFLTCHEPLAEWMGGACWTNLFWKEFESVMRIPFEVFWPIGVPCMSGSWYHESKNRKLETWARWCEEVVHMHDAITL